MDNKIIILALEDPSTGLFESTCRAFGVEGIDPINFIEPESHTLASIYKEIFKDELANQLMGYLVHKQDTLLVWEIINKLQDHEEKIVMVNATLLTDEDIRFLTSVEDHVLVYELDDSPQRCARDIYDGSKAYMDEVGL